MVEQRDENGFSIKEMMTPSLSANGLADPIRDPIRPHQTPSTPMTNLLDTMLNTVPE